MFLYIIAFLAGDLCLQWFSALPNFFVIGMATLVCVSFSIITRHYIGLAFILGFLWTFYIAHDHLSWSLAKEDELKPQLLQGTIASIPVKTTFNRRFIFALSHTHASLMLHLASDLPIHTGQTWQFLVKLKRIHGTQSPGAFDYEAWALQNNIRASGNILDSSYNKLLNHSYFSYPIAQLREYFHNKLHVQVTNPLLLCLILGERDEFTQDQWRVLRNTGTNHLFAIAGLHIGIVALLIHKLISFYWRRHKKLMDLFSAQQAGSLGALLGAISYSLLSGFALPTQRATIMLALFTYTLLKRSIHNPWSIWAFTLLLLLIINPLSVLSESFWLSMVTIALIIYGMQGRVREEGWWWKWGRVQWVIAVGLLPLSFLFFQQISLISFVANSIAIPWLSLILPICLLAFIFLFISQSISHFIFFIADKLMASLWWLLNLFASLPLADYTHVSPAIFFIFFIPAILLLLMTRHFPGKFLALLWFIPFINWQPNSPVKNKFFVSILDVGQGLSVVIQTANHILVYDAGLHYSDRLNMGEAVVTPFLRTYGINQIDKLIISHADLDHLGGAEFLWNNFKINHLITSAPEKITFAKANFCRSGMKWNWDEINFEFIYPDKRSFYSKNDASCVLRISNHNQTILLPGDIEKVAENKLSKKKELLATTILIAPHHGSKTSALPSFIAETHPRYVIYATGYQNRFHFPHNSVVKAYEGIRAYQFNTAFSGTITMEIDKDIFVHEYRKEHKRYWMD